MSIPLKEAQEKLPELIHQLTPGEELVITENDQPVARILPAAQSGKQRTLGSMRGTVLQMAADFDAPADESSLC